MPYNKYSAASQVMAGSFPDVASQVLLHRGLDDLQLARAT